MSRAHRLAIIPCLLLAGCAGTECRAPAGVSSLSPSSVSAVSTHEDELVRWGGVLIEARNLKTSTELEVVGYPLDECGRPRTDSAQVGRFIIVRPGFLEIADYRTGSQVSATGRIAGIRDGRVGAAEYSYPLLETHKVQLWPDERAGGGFTRPWITIGIGGGSGGVYRGIGGGVGVSF
jgi:outer membrane lipoprotein